MAQIYTDGYDPTSVEASDCAVINMSLVRLESAAIETKGYEVIDHVIGPHPEAFSKKLLNP